MVPSFGRMAPLAFGFLAWVVPTSDALAQGNTFNPFGNSGYADYREFAIPMYSNNPALPGQTRLDSQPIISRPRANSFQQYSDSLDGRDADSMTRGSSAGVPYYQAYRQYDKEYNRVYRPNASADEGFEERLKKREQDYAKALREPDPVKRERLLQALRRDSLDRPATKARTAKAATPAKGAVPANGARAAAPAPSNARPAAPATIRPPGTNPARRAPATGVPATPRPNAVLPAERGVGPAPDPSTIAIPPPR